jgi:uncharacterized membrane protein YeaQ/YmgE (transglycosylase-associated protein family)
MVNSRRSVSQGRVEAVPRIAASQRQGVGPEHSSARRQRMNLIIVIIVGGILGWLASIVMRTNAQQGILLNIVVGIVGALLAGFLISPLLGIAPITSGAFDISALLVSFLGALILLAIVNLVRRGSVR